MASLTTSTLQARFNAGCPTFRKRDKNVGHKIASAEGVEESVGNYWKRLLDCAELRAVYNIITAARSQYYRRSTEWLEGVRVMPVAAYHEFRSEFRDYKTEWQAHVDKFLAAYDSLVSAAPQRLRGLYDPSDYPPLEHVTPKFYMDFRIMPFPDVDTDFRVQLIAEEVEEARESVRKEYAIAQRKAAQDLFTRIEDRMQAMHEALAHPDRKLYDSTFEHTVTLCEDIRILNFTSDPDVETLRQDMLRKLATLNPDVIRASTGVPGGQRELAAQAAASIMAKVNQLRGV